MEPRVAKRMDQLFQYLSADAAIAFSVVDRSERKPSRRFFSWPCGSNPCAFQDGYEPRVPLHHISSYLNAASGCTDSPTPCLDQVGLPPSLRERVVCADAAHRRWCLTRLPMTHAIAVELVQIILSTLCGHPSYALQNFVTAPEVQLDVWVRAVHFYKVLRTVCWRLSEIQEEPGALLKEEELPLDAPSQLGKWHTSVANTAPQRVKVESLPNMTLLLELFTEHWFSVLVGEESRETWNTGGSLEDVLGTKAASAAIAKAAECFQPCIEKGAHVSIQY